MVLKLREGSPSLWDGAKCHQVTVTSSYDPFFEWEDEIDEQETVDFCNGEADGRQCPLRDKCLLFSLVNNEKFGIWGGSKEITRKAIRKKYPAKGGKPNPGWHWMSEEEALEGLDRNKLQRELDEEKRNEDNF